MRNWILNKLNIYIQIDLNTVVFGMSSNLKMNKIINFILLVTKYYIYRTKIREEKLHIFSLQNTLKDSFYIEKYVIFNKCKWLEFTRYWEKWFKLFEEN